MDSFRLLKRRTTDLFNSIPQSLPSIQSLSLGHHGGHALTMKATWEKIAGLPPLPRSSHSVNVVGGTVYIFGGESADPRKPADNDMHAVTLPSSGAQADYYTIEAKADEGESRKPAAIPLTTTTDSETPAPTDSTDKGKAIASPPLGDVPSPRVGHATATIGHRIFLFGGRGPGPDALPLDEGGRVWVFDTRTNLWSHLDPAAAAVSIPATIPEPRSHHAAVATDKPDKPDLTDRHHHPKPTTRTEGWKEWARGDSDEVGIPQRPIVGNVAEHATDADTEGYGTLIIHGGRLANSHTRDTAGSDVWAFDVHSRVWQRLPDAPGTPRGSPALALGRHGRLYRFGGRDEQGREEGGRLDVLDLAVDSFNDEFSAGEVAISARRGGWQALLPLAERPRTRDEDIGYKEVDVAEAPLRASEVPPKIRDGEDPWPGPRSAAAFEAVTVGGREYLVLMLGERYLDAGGDTDGGAGADAGGGGGGGGSGFWDDVWAFQVPSHGAGVLSAASLADSVRSAVGGRKSAEGRWARVEAAPHDDEDDESAEGPGPRGWVASSAMNDVEENAVVVWGGVGAAGRRFGDGWILRLG